MTDEELKDLVAGLIRQQKVTSEIVAETSRKVAENSERVTGNSEKIAELIQSQKKTDAQLKETNKQLGRIGNKFGRYLEELMYPSIEKMLLKDFEMMTVGHRVKQRRNGTSLELDIFAYSNQKSEAYIVEIKSSYGEEEFQQTMKTLAAFPKFFPEFADKKVYGVVAAVDIAENMRNRVINAGLYLVRIGEDLFKMQVPRNFVPKDYGAGNNGQATLN